jgi:hypothetical protein
MHAYGETSVQPASETIYASSNGDKWVLTRGINGRMLVRHEANEPSGGHVTEFEVEDFLRMSSFGPQHNALWELLQAADAELPSR